MRRCWPTEASPLPLSACWTALDRRSTPCSGAGLEELAESLTLAIQTSTRIEQFGRICDGGRKCENWNAGTVTGLFAFPVNRSTWKDLGGIGAWNLSTWVENELAAIPWIELALDPRAVFPYGWTRSKKEWRRCQTREFVTVSGGFGIHQNQALRSWTVNGMKTTRQSSLRGLAP